MSTLLFDLTLKTTEIHLKVLDRAQRFLFPIMVLTEEYLTMTKRTAVCVDAELKKKKKQLENNFAYA